MKLKIADMKLGESITAALVVTSALTRNTKAGKEFLTLEFFDGFETITGNYWNWAGKNIPAVNTILNVTAQVTEYLGQKQLNIQALTTSTDHVLAEFTPQAEVDLSQAFKDCYELASDIRNDLLRQVCWTAFEDMKSAWIAVPGAKSIHHAYIGGTLVHTASVAKIAKSIAAAMPMANMDLTVAGALLHDVGKLWTYKLDGLAIGLTVDGTLMDHLYIGAKYVETLCRRLAGPSISEADDMAVTLLVHIILSHHGKQEYGSVVPPMCVEAHIVHAADLLDSSQEQIRIAAKKTNAMFTDKIWTLDNKPHISPEFVRSILGDTK